MPYVAYDQKNLILYVNISQVFRIWLVPFYKAAVNLTTVLRLTYDKRTNRYHIKSQDDLYQVNEFVKFVWLGGPIIVWIWQFFATIMCLLGAALFWPISYVEESQQNSDENGPTSLIEESQALVKDVKVSARHETPPALLQR